MAMKKIAISLPEPVLERVDKLAASRGESKSRLIATVLDRVVRAKHDRDITRADRCALYQPQAPG